MLNGLPAKVNALLAKFEGSKHVDDSVTSISSVSPFYSIKPSAAAKPAIKSVPESMNDPKSGRFFGSWYNKYKYVFRVNLAKWDGIIRVRCLFRKLGPVE
ncbi:hypothetical protein ACTXT7_004080 [Hymenolepis weldensis]